MKRRGGKGGRGGWKCSVFFFFYFKSLLINFFILKKIESDNSPARVVLVSIPSRKEIVSKSLFNVSDCRMHWQGAGDYLCVKVDRHTKTKKSTYTNFELFKIRSKNVPIEVLEHKESILAFAWEPTGSKFAIIILRIPARSLVSFLLLVCWFVCLFLIFLFRCLFL